MLRKQQTKKDEGLSLSDSKGFTIIEVLIVLAIAGLILLIVFLAVPALQRNARNTRRANDVSRALGAAQEVLNNNNGNMAALTDANLQAAIGDPSYYVAADITVADGQALGAPTNTTTIDTVVIYKGGTCANAQQADKGSVRELAAVFTVEKDVERCQAS